MGRKKPTAKRKPPIKKKAKSSNYQRRLNVAYQKKRSRAGKKAAIKLKGRVQTRAQKQKLRMYRHLVKDYVAKQEQIGGKNDTYAKAVRSDEMKQLLKDLRSNDPFLKKAALKKTIRRDSVPDSIAVGETPSAFVGG